MRQRRIRKLSLYLGQKQLTSSSSRTCSKPTFCPRECFADDPQTMALEGGPSQHVFDTAGRSLLFHVLCDLLVDRGAEIFNSASAFPQHHGLLVIRCKTSRLCVSRRPRVSIRGPKKACPWRTLGLDQASPTSSKVNAGSVMARPKCQLRVTHNIDQFVDV